MAKQIDKTRQGVTSAKRKVNRSQRYRHIDINHGIGLVCEHNCYHTPCHGSISTSDGEMYHMLESLSY